MALALTSFGSLRALNLLPADLSAPGHQMVFSNANRNHRQVAGRRSRRVEQRPENPSRWFDRLRAVHGSCPHFVRVAARTKSASCRFVRPWPPTGRFLCQSKSQSGSGATHELDLPSILSLVSSPVDWSEPLKINPHRPGEYQQA